MEAKAYKKGLSDLLRQEIPAKIAEKRRLLSQLRNMQTNLIISNVAISTASEPDADIEADLKKLAKKIKSVEATMRTITPRIKRKPSQVTK